ncbi:MAG: c-type cytochrome [Campylobacterales bacterium]|nr:c-type cytochrome [Campylobacterales bacterium]
MKTLKTVLATSLVATMAMANPSITAIKVDDGVDLSKVKADDKIWSKAKQADIALYPQTTIKMNDKNANEINAKNSAKEAKILAIYNSKDIAFKVEWKDTTDNTTNAASSSTEYADGFAVQMPTNFSEPKKLPYIGMGSDGRPVLVHLQKAVTSHYEPNGNKDVSLQVNRHQTNAFEKDLEAYDKNVTDAAISDYQRAYISEGFRSMTQIRDKDIAFNMDMSYNIDTWSATMSKSLKDSYLDLSKSGAFPVAFAVWDGAKLGRDGIKNLSTWVAVDFEGKKGNEALVEELTKKPEGDAAAGKALVDAMCASCHSYADKVAAMPTMAPNLSNIGGYSTEAYLVESIKEPSAVVVPGYNRNAHKNTAWYTVDAKGNRASTMPPMMSDDKQIADAVAYLMTLKAEVK